jgi:lysozyme family protein
MFNRGPGGAAWILQQAVGVETDGDVGPITLAAAQAAEADPRRLIDRLRASREAYERLRRDETSRFWPGLVNRWTKAHAKAIEFMGAPAVA